MLLVLRLATLLDHLAAAIGPTAFADTVRAHQLVALRAYHQRRRIQALVLAAVATAVARNFGFWCSTHECIPDPFLDMSYVLFVQQAFENRETVILFVVLALARPGV